MDEERQMLARLEQLLQENVALAEENNRLLRELRRAGRMAFWFRVVVWAAVIILPFLLIGPLIKALVPAVGGDTSGLNYFGFPSTEQLEQTAQQYQELLEGS